MGFFMNKNILLILVFLGMNFHSSAEESIPSSLEPVQSAVFKVENNDGSVYGSGFFVEDNRTFVTTFDLMYKLINLEGSFGLSSIFITKGNQKFQIKSVTGIFPLDGVVFLEVEANIGEFLALPKHSIFYKNKEAYTMAIIANELNILKWSQILEESGKRIAFIGSHTHSIKGYEGGPVLNRYGEAVGIHVSSFQVEGQDIPNIVKVKHLTRLLNQSFVSENNQLTVKEQFQKALKNLESLAQRGDAEAQFVYANILLEMNDIKEALLWYRKSAKQGFALAQYKLAIMFYKGIGVPENKTIALSWFRKSAKQGVALAQYNLGIMFYNGDGVPEDKKQAVELLRQAAEKGISSAQYHSGSILYVGVNGVLQNKKEAASLYRQAAEAGHANAQHNLAVMLFKGDGIPRDKEQAVDWYRKAAEQGIMEAQLNLALIMRDNMRNNKKDSNSRIEAVHWFRQAAKQGSVEAQYELGLILLNSKTGNTKEKQEAALKRLTIAAEKNFVPAQYELGKELYRRANNKEDRVKAFSWLEKAAEQGHHEAAQEQINKLSKPHIRYMYRCRDVFRGLTGR